MRVGAGKYDRRLRAKGLRHINIPIEEGLLREINYAAGQMGMRQKEWVVKVLADEVSRGFGKELKVEPKKSAVEVDSVKKCGLHGCAMMDFGTTWACEGPPFHTEVK